MYNREIEKSVRKIGGLSILELEMNERQGIIVWVYSLKHMKTLKKQGLIHYVSKKMKYVVLYVNRADIDAVEEKLNSFHFVRKVERSHRPEIDMNFDHVLQDLREETAADEKTAQQEKTFSEIEEKSR